MCRFAVYHGRPIVLKDFILDVPHSIFRQSFDAREMLSGNVNGDGFGIAWYDSTISENPAVYVATTPIWADYNIGRIADKIRSNVVVAHVRGASEGMPVSITNTHPFTAGPFAFMHNGSVDDFRSSIFPGIVPHIRPDIWNRIKGNTDSEHVFGWWLSEMEDWEKRRPTLQRQTDALKKVIGGLCAIAAEAGTEIVLNLAISDGQSIIAVRYHHGQRKASLYYAVNSPKFPESTIIASEKLFDGAEWQPVPEKSMLTIDPSHRVEITPL
jgi:glutamine amidotransferase